VTLDVRDITIIGGGPTGLFGAFYAGLRDASCRIIDNLPELGGQLTALYPEKYIYDVAGFPKILAKDLVKGLVQQGLQFGADVRLGQQVLDLTREPLESGEEVFVLGTPDGRVGTRAIVVAAGIGPFAPRRLGIAGEEGWLGRGLEYHVGKRDDLQGKRVLLVGGGDSAFDWAVGLQGVAAAVSIAHRRDVFKAHAATIKQVMDLATDRKVALRTFCEVTVIHGGERIEAVTLRDSRTKTEERLAVDVVVALLGFVSRLGAVAGWGIEIAKDEILVSSRMETSRPGIFAAGDIVTYPGKLKLITTAVGEAAVAVNGAVTFLRPDAKFTPGHSSHMEHRFGAVGGGT